MKKLLLSTALLGGMAFPALAQEQNAFREAPEALEIRASDFMGMRLYASEAAVESGEAAGLQEGWEDIGEVNDIVMNRDGQLQAVLVDVGGFLGIGERTVAVSMDALRFMSDSATAENADDFFLVINASRDQLEQAPEYSAIVEGDMSAEDAVAETEQVIEEGASDMAAADATMDEAAQEVEATGETMAEGAENAGEEMADETAGAGQEVAEEVDQLDMTDAQEDQTEVADAQADASEEAVEETAQAPDETAEAETTVESTATETEMEADQTAEAATEEVTATETAETDAAATEGEETAGEVVTIVEGDETTTGEMSAEEMTADGAAAEEVSDAEMASSEREPTVREGFGVAAAEDLTADRLQGAGVYDANDERIGEVGELLLSDDGQVSELVIDVGGFLGIGEKPVALAMDSVEILRQEGGEEIRVYVSQTEEELEAMPGYEAQE